MGRNKKGHKKLHRPKVDAKKLRMDAMFQNARHIVYEMLDEKVPGWREDSLMKVRIDKVVRQEVEAKVKGVISTVQLVDASERLLGSLPIKSAGR